LLERTKARLDTVTSDQRRLTEEAASSKEEVKELTKKVSDLQAQFRVTQTHDAETTLRNQQLVGAVCTQSVTLIEKI
jgi:hypothetical protein